MKNIKKLITGVLITVLLITLLTACSYTESDNSPDDSQSTSESIGATIKLNGKVMEVDTVGIALLNPTDINFLYDYGLTSIAPDEKSAQENDAEWWKNRIVVIGEFIEDAHEEPSYLYDEYFKREVISSRNSYTKLRITEVLKGDIKPGDVIIVHQSYGYNEEERYLSTDERTPMNKGDRWIHFLYHVDFEGGDYYASVGRAQGRYPIPDSEMKSVMDEYLGKIREIEGWLSERKVDSTYYQAYYQGKVELWNYDENGGIHIPNPDKNAVYYLTENDFKEWLKMHETVESLKITDKIETSALGVYKREDFNFGLYAEILDYFKIEAQDWTNPGRDFDAKLIELAKQQ